MKKIRVLMIDDNQSLVDMVKEYFTNHSKIEVVLSCKDGEEGLDTIINKDISDRFLTSLILSLLVCLASLVLAILGLLLFLSPGETFVSAFETVQTKL